jgi:hypothetical protein
MGRLWLASTSDHLDPTKEKSRPKLSLGVRFKATAAARTKGAKVKNHGRQAPADAFGRKHGENP